mmetsp:Transcript_38739/g.81458  ORF Transcript_38739/g.81458 Transcript_38739/m.81458 type:complete len:225 (+) Transcript_38739:215-889(+)
MESQPPRPSLVHSSNNDPRQGMDCGTLRPSNRQRHAHNLPQRLRLHPPPALPLHHLPQLRHHHLGGIGVPPLTHLRQGHRLPSPKELRPVRQRRERHVSPRSVVRTLHARVAIGIAGKCRAHPSRAGTRSGNGRAAGGSEVVHSSHAPGIGTAVGIACQSANFVIVLCESYGELLSGKGHGGIEVAFGTEEVSCREGWDGKCEVLWKLCGDYASFDRCKGKGIS